jgi:hypothetical protein
MKELKLRTVMKMAHVKRTIDLATELSDQSF